MIAGFPPCHSLLDGVGIIGTMIASENCIFGMECGVFVQWSTIMGRLRVLFLGVIATGWMLAYGDACANQATDDLLADELESELVCLPRRDMRPLKETLHKLFGNGDESRLVQLAGCPNANVAMWARWELRRTSFTQAFNVNSCFYPVRFLELKGIEVPSAWAKKFAVQFFLTELRETEGPGGLRVLDHQSRNSQIKDLYDQAVEHYRTHATTTSRMSFIDMDPSTYVHYTNADVPAGTTVHESETELVVEQAGMQVRLEKPLTKNRYTIIAGYGEDVFLPLLASEKTFILTGSGSHMLPFELTCFDTQSGTQNWETVGWCGLPQRVEVLPRNVLSLGEEEVLLRTIVGEIMPPGRDNDPGRGGGASGPHYGACCWYLTANDRFVTVFGSEEILSVEVFDIKTGHNVLRFATDYHGDAEAAARGQTMRSSED